MKMTDKTLQILLALVEGPLHGYGIKGFVEDRTEGRVRLGSGTLYEAIHRLENKGWIREVTEASPDEVRESGGPPRRLYALTPEGREAAERELARLAEVVRFGRAKGLLPDQP